MIYVLPPRSLCSSMPLPCCCIAYLFRLALLIGLLLSAANAQNNATGSDSGSSIAPLAAKSLLLDGTRAGNRLVVVGERGHVLLSDDNGDSWRQVSVPTRVTLTAVSFVDARHGWAVGHDAIILYSADAGEHWQIQHQDIALQSPLLDVAFSDPSQGLACGAYGLLLHTGDGGANWRPIHVHDEDDYHLNAIATRGERHYLAAEAGMAYRYNGQQWQSLTTPYEGSFFGVLTLPDDGLLLLGLRGHLYRSSDDGAHWTRIETGSSNTLTDALRLTDGRIAIAGHAGTVLLSDDNGEHFQTLSMPDRPALSALLQAADGRLLGIGEKGIHAIPLPPLRQADHPNTRRAKP